MELIKNISQFDDNSPELETRAEKPKKKRLSAKARNYIFIIIMLFYPILQFVITWSFVNIRSLMFAFQTGDLYGNYEFVGFKTIADAFVSSFSNSINTTGVSWLNNSSVIILNSLGFAVITIFISLPLSLIFSYFLTKKMPLANVFRVIFFLPNIIPIVALTFAFSMSFKADYGFLYSMLKWMGMADGALDKYPLSQLMVYAYCIWAGLGYNIILISGAIGRIPKELFESAKIDNCGYFKEFVHVVLPMIWPTIITLIVLGMTNVLTLYLQPMFLTKGEGNTYTLSLQIWDATTGGSPAKLCEAAAKGLIFSVMWAPIILLTRKLLSKKFSEVDY